MPRHRPPPRGAIGRVLSLALDERGLSPQQAAAAAGVHKGTLYKVLAGQTRSPHHSTLRRLCKVLRVDIASILGAEQLELISDDLEMSGRLSAIEELLVLELRSFRGEVVQMAVEMVIRALLEVKLGMGRGPGTSYLKQAHRFGGNSIRRAEVLVLRQLRQIPPIAQPAAVRTALGSLADLRMMRGAQPSAELFQNIDRLRHRLWLGMERPKRRRVRDVGSLG